MLLNAREAMGRIDGESETFVPVAFGWQNSAAQGGARANSILRRWTNLGVVLVHRFTQNQRDEVRTMDIAGALASDPGAKQQTYAHVGMQVRRLTPRECERLRELPDDYTLVTHRGKPAADGPRVLSVGQSRWRSSAGSGGRFSGASRNPVALEWRNGQRRTHTRRNVGRWNQRARRDGRG